ncbi:ferrochelatase [Skeletonema marinoi]|uniref:Ferrochelatase n=1 Tax=Skeletonema marinoi TaxID=267567 RepID=A0AAD9DF60_9STRA|nr:ferrochelatase [Skeletonema marinoi]
MGQGSFKFSSRVGPVEWLRPYTDDVLPSLGEQGVKNLVVVPISFVSEHIETLEEIDIEYRELALESGITNWRRSPALNTDPTFIDDMADMVADALSEPSQTITEACVANNVGNLELEPVSNQLEISSAGVGGVGFDDNLAYSSKMRKDRLEARATKYPQQSKRKSKAFQCTYIAFSANATLQELIPIGIDLGRSRYTLALVGSDKMSGEDDNNSDAVRHIFGEAARRALARDKKPTISKDPSSMVQELVKSSSSVDGGDNNKSSAAAAFFGHLADLACDASSSHPSKLRAVVSVNVGASPEEQAGVVETIEAGVSEALKSRSDVKQKKKDVEPIVVGVITDPAAVCIAHGLTEVENSDAIDLAASNPDSWTNALVVDWGASGLQPHISGGKSADKAVGASTRKVKACPVNIGIAKSGDEENAVPLIEVGQALPANTTRNFTYNSGEEIVIVQMNGGAAKSSKVLGKIEKLPADKSFEITMELSAVGKLSLSVNGGPMSTL